MPPKPIDRLVAIKLPDDEVPWTGFRGRHRTALARTRAVLDALGMLDKAFREHFEAFRPKHLYRCQALADPADEWVALPKQGY